MTPTEEERRLMAEAAEITRRDVFKAITQNIQYNLFQQWLLTKPEETDKREVLWRTAQVAGDFDRIFGNLAAQHDAIKDQN